jgi:hypothetical protein
MDIVRVPMSEPVPNTRAERSVSARIPRAFDTLDASWREEVRRRIRATEFISALSPEVLAKLQSMEEPAASGGPAPKRPGL